MNIFQTIADELNIQLWQVEATVKLFEDGSTVPFVARYRKEVTGELDDTQLRKLEERHVYLTELNERRDTILKSIESQGKLTEKLKDDILNADNKARLEDLYLPYKPKRRTKGQIAIEAGLQPLADSIFKTHADPEVAAKDFINTEHKIDTVELALEGAKHILMEQFSEDADLIAKLREKVWQEGVLTSKIIKDKEKDGQKFSDYFEYQEPIKNVPSHRALAVFRGQKEGVLRVNIELNEQQEQHYIQNIADNFKIQSSDKPALKWLSHVVDWTWKIKLKLKIEVDLLMRLREASEEGAINVFKDNLKNLLMSAPAGHKRVLGLDPGLRTGVKVAVIDETGKLLDHTTIFPHAPKKQWDSSLVTLTALVKKYEINLICIGNGTASRETDRLAAELIKQMSDHNLTKLVVSEAGASVYSASELAAEEFPDLDVSFRGAVSIARRVQDPLAELVKIDPKAIGVGQYQHDVNQVRLGKGLEAVLEDCVNAVGADVNTASVPLLKSISGLNERVAKNIVTFREEHGAFKNRHDIKKVPRLGEKTFEQAIGFLRIMGGENPLDASGVHPESYPIVNEIAERNQVSLEKIFGNKSLLQAISANDYISESIGLPTVKDIISELQKPGRDPRPEFKMAHFKEGIESLNDLKSDMQLEGVITNVTNFGAFVDIGVHQDGLVHISQLGNKFIADPNKVVKVGDIVKVKVLEVDVKRKRIQLTMRLHDIAHRKTQEGKPEQRRERRERAPMTHKKRTQSNNISNNSLSLALSKALETTRK